MNKTPYTPESIAEGKRLYAVLQSAPTNKQALAALMLQAYTDGLLAGESIQTTAAKDSA